MHKEISLSLEQQRELEKKNFAADSMFKSIPGGYHRCSNEEGYPFIYVSERFLDILGWSEEELKSRFENKFINLLHPDDRNAVDSYAQRVVDKKDVKPYQSEVYRILTKQGYRWMSDTTIDVTVGEKAFFQGIITDITDFIETREKLKQEQRQKELEYQHKLKLAAEEAKRANEAKTVFLRQMSHDIRTPINGMLGLIEMAKRCGGDEAKLAEYRRRMLNNIDYLLSIVNNVLDIGKMESGEIALEQHPFDLVELMEQQRHIIEVQAMDNGLKLKSGGSLRQVTHRYLMGSPVYLTRVLINISNNAVKYTPMGGTITLMTEEISSNEETAVFRFTCQDTGVGMSEEFQKRLFKPYSQEGKATSTGLGGSGLGLSIVKAIIEQMGGKIEFESKENVGTKFMMTIPFAIDHDAHKRESALEENAPIDVQGKRALIVEDNKLNMEIAEMLFTDVGFDFDKVYNGKEAVEKFTKAAPGAYDFVFMDVMMPIMDGLEATRQIRSLERADAKTVPIVAVTANAFKDDIANSRAAGMDDYITKPLSRKDIEAVVRRQMKKRV